jgi:general secretion pathway protein D
VRFIPVDRINTLIAVAPNPGIFAEVKSWIDKLDIAVKAPAGAASYYQYRLKYGRAETVALAITAVLTGNPWAMVGLANASKGAIGNGPMGGGYSGMGMGTGGYGGNMGGYSGMGMNMGGYPTVSGYSGGYGGGYAGAYQQGGSPYVTGATNMPPISTPSGSNANPTPTAGQGSDLTGAYLGLASGAGNMAPRGPTVVPNPFDNTILVRSTPQEWEQIKDLLQQIDIPPRQVLIDAKIYELDLTGAYSAGLTAYLAKKDSGALGRPVNASTSSSGLTISAGTLVHHARELLGQINLAETAHQAHVISSPSIIATDSIPAVMNVGQDVPVLTSQGLAGGAQVGGNSPFTNTISNRSTGTTLSITARINSSGVVTMAIDQDVSAPLGASSNGIGSPSFSRRSFSTQVTVQDGDTIAIGGFIQEQKSNDSNGVPVLHRIPLLGALFGAKSYSSARTELIVFLTPRVIYDTNQIAEASDEIKSSMKRMQKMMSNDQ